MLRLSRSLQTSICRYLPRVFIGTFIASLASVSFSADIAESNVCFDNPDNYANPTMYYWNAAPAGSLNQAGWPGAQMVENSGYYCHDLGVELDSLKVIFNNAGFPQTQDLDYPGGGNNCWDGGVWKSLQDCGFNQTTTGNRPVDNLVIYFRNDANYNQPHVHYFDLVPAAQESVWPGPAMTALGGNWYSYDMGAQFTDGGFVFNDNGGAQTANQGLNPATPCFQNGAFVSLAQCEYDANPSFNYPTGKAVYFVNNPNWATPTAYIWNETPADTVADSPWPGVPMENFGGLNLWFIDIGASTSAGNIIFSNQGNNQTPDGDFAGDNLCYNNGVWMTAQACGVPDQNTAEAGPDRTANQNSQIALSAVATVGSTAGASWSSDAWTGDLTGETVVTPTLTATGTFTVTLTLDSGATDTFQLNVVSATAGLPERPLLAAPLGFPESGSVSSGNFEFESAYPNLDGMFVSPVMVLNDGVNDLIYVVDKPGTITVFPNDVTVTQAQTTQVLDIRNEVRDYHEQGLISMAFHPQFSQNGYAYIYYIEGDNDEASNGGVFDDGVVQRITLNNTTTPTGIVSGSRVEVLRVPQVGPDHKGGKMEFHPNDGLFYMSIGDGGYAATAGEPADPGDPRMNNSSQETDNLLGTFIRLEMLDSAVNGKYYAIPSDNPFVGDPAVMDEIWSYGHRNPWRWAFDQAAPYKLWETEIGQAGYEEVNIIEPGKNYGWPICEGVTHRGQAGGDPTNQYTCTGNLQGPVEGYDHSSGSVSIIGGFVYRGNSLPALDGKFIFGDYVSKRIWTVVEGQPKELLSDGFPGNISSFGTDLAGDQVLVSTHGLEFGGGVSGIYRIIDRDAAAAVIPPKLSETGLFADLTTQFPASGVIEYDVNSHVWLDGVKTRHFVSVPNGELITFSEEDVWDLPVGSVLVKHVDVPTGPSSAKALETSVLFRQVNGWEAANYYWNDAGTEADLVEASVAVSVQQYLNGGNVNVDRTIRSGGECGSCHTGVGSKNPRGFATAQTNKTFDYQGVVGNQLDVLNGIDMFATAPSSSTTYAAYVDPEDTSADLNERARVYLDTNCASCHNGTLMDLRYNVTLAEMDIMNRQVGGSQFRLLPFDHTKSVLHAFQVTESNRMPKGTNTTNPVAATLFQQWIDAVDAVPVGVSVRSAQDVDDIRVGADVGFNAFELFDNGFEIVPTGAVGWSSDSPGIIDVSGQSGGSISVTPAAQGSVNLIATVSGQSGSLAVDVLGGAAQPSAFSATALSSSAISLNWTDNALDETSYTLSRSLSSVGPFTVIQTFGANTETFVDTGLAASTRYYYEVRAISADGASLPATGFADTAEAGNTSAISIVTGNVFELLTGESRQIVALAESGGVQASATLSGAWSSSNDNIVSVSSAGVLTGGAQAGTATITVSLDGVSNSVDIANRGAGQYVYFNNNGTNWADVRIYVFATTAGNESSQMTWPGEAMEPSIEYGGKWLRFAVTADMLGQQMTEVIFNCASADCKTADLVLTQAPRTWFEDVASTQWLAQEPNGGGAVNQGTQLVVGGGQVTWANNGENLTGTLITEGATVDISADDPGVGQSFSHWEGTAAPYMLDPTSPDTKMVVPAALSLTMNAVFDTVVDQYAVGREYYRSTQAGCAGCHGVDGQGSPPLNDINAKYTLSELTDYISANMPQGNGSACTGECASSTAEMIFNGGYEPPGGLCDFESLNDMIPQDRGYRLLTVYEYNNSVRDILGLTTNVDVTTGNLPADIPVNGFKTSSQTVFNDDYAQGYVNAAIAVADLAGNNLASLAPSCGSNVSCAIQTLGKKAFRRPLTAAEQSDLMALHSTEGDKGVLITIFSAPAMLYRSEVGELVATGDELGYFRLTDYEIAAMLSYTYWGTTPDDALIAKADAGQLSTSEQIRTQVSEMLLDPRSQVAFERFVEGWLNLDKEIGTNALSDSLKSDMKEETIRFVKNIVYNGGSYRDLITADYSYMTEQLAAHYNLPWPGGSGWQQVFYSGENAQRRGVIGHASVLAIQSAQEKTHPVKRGLFVRRNLMCQDFPPPPLGAALDPESDPTKGVRYRFETSHAQEGCIACHQYIDGIGFGLESYNAVGQFVTTETTDNGSVLPINANGYIGSLDSAETFLSESEPVIDYLGLDQLSGLVADSANGKACYARQWFRYARGRREASEDSCTLQGFGNDFKVTEGTTLLDLMIDYTQTRNYTLRK